VTDPLTYVLSALRRAADNSYPWSVTPGEAGALVSEVERLRGHAADLRLMVDGLETAAHEERAAVVSYLRGLADDYGVCLDLSLDEQADIIERGEHRRKGDT
jgi:hypothetical protein